MIRTPPPARKAARSTSEVAEWTQAQAEYSEIEVQLRTAIDEISTLRIQQQKELQVRNDALAEAKATSESVTAQLQTAEAELQQLRLQSEGVVDGALQAMKAERDKAQSQLDGLHDQLMELQVRLRVRALVCLFVK